MVPGELATDEGEIAGVAVNDVEHRAGSPEPRLVGLPLVEAFVVELLRATRAVQATERAAAPRWDRITYEGVEIHLVGTSPGS